MAYDIYDSSHLEHNGRTYRVELSFDGDIGPPWKWSDGHGVVSEWTSRDKAPGERVLVSDRTSKRYYDVQETMKIARRDGWGLGRDDESKLAQTLGRAPTQGEIIAAAVEKDFEYLRSWCNNEWHWACLGVHHESGESEYLGGIASNDYDYIKMEARALADEIASRLDAALAADIQANSHLEARP